MGETSKILRGWRMRGVLCIVVSVICVCASVSAVNIADAGDKCECER